MSTSAKSAEAKSGGGSKVALAVGAILLIAAGAGVFLLTRSIQPGAADEVAKKVADSSLGKQVAAAVSEGERYEYVQKYVELSDVKLEQDSFVDSTGATKEVPGLMRVTGLVRNKGDKQLDSLKVEIMPLDEQNNVLSSIIEEVLGKRPLKPGEEKAFKFQIPARSAKTGRFIQKLR